MDLSEVTKLESNSVAASNLQRAKRWLAEQLRREVPHLGFAQVRSWSTRWVREERWIEPLFNLLPILPTDPLLPCELEVIERHRDVFEACALSKVGMVNGIFQASKIKQFIDTQLRHNYGLSDLSMRGLISLVMHLNDNQGYNYKQIAQSVERYHD